MNTSVCQIGTNHHRFAVLAGLPTVNNDLHGITLRCILINRLNRMASGNTIHSVIHVR